jgi:hypothetical protein
MQIFTLFHIFSFGDAERRFGDVVDPRERPDEPSHLYGAGNLCAGAGADFRLYLDGTIGQLAVQRSEFNLSFVERASMALSSR